MWQPLLRSTDVPPGAVVAAAVDDTRDGEVVVWRAADGTPCAVARTCPHLDWDLLDAAVVGDELVCAGHGWSILGDGQVFKRNEFGRVDAKGATRWWPLREHDGIVDAEVT